MRTAKFTDKQYDLLVSIVETRAILLHELKSKLELYMVEELLIVLDEAKED